MNGNRGLIRELLLLFLALIIFGYYGISVREVVQSPTSQDNISYVSTGATSVWDNYLKLPASYLWNIYVDDIWSAAIHNLEAMKNNQPTDLQQKAPQLPYPGFVP